MSIVIIAIILSVLPGIPDFLSVTTVVSILISLLVIHYANKTCKKGLETILNDFFGVKSSIEVITDKKSFKYIREYFSYFTENEKYTFLRNKLKNNFNNYYIEVNNESEKKQLQEMVEEINEKLSKVGINISK